MSASDHPPEQWVTHREASTSSTQDVAHKLATAGAPSRTVVVADAQSAGRGRGGRAWVSHDGALLFSFILRRDVMGDALGLERLPFLTQLFACALVDTCRDLGADAWVKWPNDIMLPHFTSGRQGPFLKAGGILVETALTGSDLDYVVCGAGLNLVPPPRGFPVELHDIATSLFPSGTQIGRADALSALTTRLEQWLVAIDADRIAQAQQTLRTLSTVVGRSILVDGDPARALNIADDGALVIRRHTSAPEERVYAGDICWAPRARD